MDFYEIFDQVIALLKERERVTYRTLRRQFALDDESLEDLKEELLFSHPVTDEDGRGLVWNGKTGDATEPILQPAQPDSRPVVEQTQPIQERSSVEPHTSDAERRQLTVMFVDMVDSTRLSGELDPEDLRDIVRAYQSACTEVITQYDGHVAQLLGDGLLVYFGYPQAHEDDPQRTVHTGLGIIESLKNLNVRLKTARGIQLSVRVGIHTGLVVVGEIGSGGRQEQLALGETPNIAARIEGIAEPNTVVISADTHRLVEGYFDCQIAGEYSLKGVAQPITAYRVLQESETQNRLDVTASRGLTPLIGRESELALLLDRWEQAKSGQGQMVLLSGEVGIGKSRLTRTLRERVSTEPHNRLECRCSPYFQNTTLYPLLDLLERTLGFERHDTPATKLQKLETVLSQYRLDIKTTLPLLAFPLSIPLPEDWYPPLNLTPQSRKEKVLEAFIAMMLETAEREPALFILEDLHWVDATTIELLDLLIEQVPTASILAVLTCRPDFQPPWGLKSHLTPIALNRLPRHQIEMLVERVADGKRLPDEVIHHLIEKTDGVPLYVEEMTKVLLESGHLKENDTGYELTEPLSTLSIPATLQDSLMARLDNLDSAKGVAQLGATIGRQFSYDLLQAVSPLGETSLKHELDRLVDAELIYQRGVTPNPTYFFKHALVQDTAYESLLRSTRQGYHQRIAEVLAERFPEVAETQPELLAHHFTEAGFDQQAVGYWQKAAEQAVERSANVEAIEHYKKALEVLKKLPDTPERTEQELILLIASGTPLMVTQGYGSSDVELVYTQAHALCQKVEDSPHLFSTLLGLSRVSMFHAEYQRVRELGEQLLAFAERLQQPERFLEAHFTLGSALLSMGELEASLFHIQKSRSIYESQQHRSLRLVSGHDHEVGCFTYQARTLWFLGYPDQALSCIYAALIRARDLSHSFSQARALTFMAFLHQYRREARQTQDCTEELLAISYEHDYAQWVSMGMIMRGWALAMQGQVENGISQVEEGMAAQERMGHRHARSWWLVILAEAHRTASRVDDGLHVLAEASTLIEQTEQRFLEAEIYRLKGELLLQQSSDTHAEAETCFHQALDIARQQQAKSLELRAATSLARLWQSQGKRDEARELLAPVYEWFTEGFDTADLIDAKALLDELSEGR